MITEELHEVKNFNIVDNLINIVNNESIIQLDTPLNEISKDILFENFEKELKPLQYEFITNQWNDDVYNIFTHATDSLGMENFIENNTFEEVIKSVRVTLEKFFNNEKVVQFIHKLEGNSVDKEKLPEVYLHLLNSEDITISEDLVTHLSKKELLNHLATNFIENYSYLYALPFEHYVNYLDDDFNKSHNEFSMLLLMYSERMGIKIIREVNKALLDYNISNEVYASKLKELASKHTDFITSRYLNVVKHYEEDDLVTLNNENFFLRILDELDYSFEQEDINEFVDIVQ